MIFPKESMRSGSSVDKPRARGASFCGWMTVLGIVLAFLLLLALLYPKQSLLELLNHSSDVSPAVLRYREAILRIDPGNLQFRLKLADDLVAAGICQRAVEVLERFDVEPLSLQNRARGVEIRCRALKGLLLSLASDHPDRVQVAGYFSRQIRALIELDPEPDLARRMAEDALAVGDEATAFYLLQQYESAEEALARGDFRKSAQLHFRAMQQAQGLSQRREQFQRGVKALQAGNLIGEALEMGEAQLGKLASDRASLLFLSRIALAADRPEKAEVLIKKALGMDSGKTPKGRG